MTQQQKEQISKLRANGASFGKIASVLGMSVNTVKSYCKRNPVSAEPVPVPKAVVHSDRCPQCNAQLEQSPGHRQKRFCSPKCRIAWWAAHPEQMTRKKLFSVECQHCSGVFMQYGSRPRKFCSRGCYLVHRYMDESFFEQSQALFGVVREVVPLPNGDLLLGIADIAEDASELSADNRQMTYHRLSDLQLMYMPLDAQELDPNGLLSERG